MTDKTRCQVPHCPRWTRRAKGEWICATHWPGVPRQTKAWLRRAFREEDRAETFALKVASLNGVENAANYSWTRSGADRQWLTFDHGDEPASRWAALYRARRRAWAAWTLAKRQAVESAAGL